MRKLHKKVRALPRNLLDGEVVFGIGRSDDNGTWTYSTGCIGDYAELIDLLMRGIDIVSAQHGESITQILADILKAAEVSSEKNSLHGVLMPTEEELRRANEEA